MNSKIKKLFFLSAIALISGLSSCTKDEVPVMPEAETPVFISNEGAYGNANASISVFYPTENKILNNVFQTANGRGIGDVLQSITVYNDRVYMVVNNSNKIEVAAKSDLKEKGVILGLNMPRYMVATGTTGYVSCWGNGGYIAKVNLSTLTIEDTLHVGSGPEQMLIKNQKLWVTNSGGFMYDSLISVIDLNNFTLTKTIVVSQVPRAIVEGRDDNIWVLCSGRVIYDDAWNPIGHVPSKLIEIKSSTYIIENEVEAFATVHPNQLLKAKDGNSFILGGGYGVNGLFRFELSNETLQTPAINEESFYGFGILPNGEIAGFKAFTFSSAGKMLRLTSSGTLIQEHEVGIGPNGLGI